MPLYPPLFKYIWWNILPSILYQLLFNQAWLVSFVVTRFVVWSVCMWFGWIKQWIIPNSFLFNNSDKTKACKICCFWEKNNWEWQKSYLYRKKPSISLLFMHLTWIANTVVHLLLGPTHQRPPFQMHSDLNATRMFPPILISQLFFHSRRSETFKRGDTVTLF